MGARDDLLAIPDEVLRNGNIAQAVLVHMDFRDTPKRWWTGFGDLNAGAHTWQGLGDLISISQITSSYKPSAKPATFEVEKPVCRMRFTTETEGVFDQSLDVLPVVTTTFQEAL